MLRAFASHTGEGGKRVRERLERGDYFTDEEMIPLFEQRLLQADTVHGYILEGFPRTLTQAQALDVRFDIVVYLHLAPEMASQRLLARHRSDDTPEIVSHRLEQYQRQADQVLQFYRDQDLLEEVDAGQPVEKVLADIFAQLNLNR
jgi:adenylate kinase